jgi:hypothetical protein
MFPKNTKKLDEPEKNGESSLKTRGYVVQGRHMGTHSLNYNKVDYGQEWSSIPIPPHAYDLVGYHRDVYHYTNTLPYTVAQYVRWWFLANLEMDLPMPMSFETRIIEVQLNVSYTREYISVIDPLDYKGEVPDGGYDQSMVYKAQKAAEKEYDDGN